MAFAETTKPATPRDAVKPVSKMDQLGSTIYSNNMRTATDLQVLLLQRRFNLATPAAIAYATLAYGRVAE